MDLPGFDTSIELHNKAIDRYLSKSWEDEVKSDAYLLHNVMVKFVIMQLERI